MNVLVLCTGNSARSILLESILNGYSKGRIIAYSAGSKPTGIINPATISILDSAGLPTDNLTSKSWDGFSGSSAPVFDLVITVCDNAHDEACPYWPGAPIIAHWGIADPARVTHPPQAVTRAFSSAYKSLHRRAAALIALPFESMSRAELDQKLLLIGDI